METSVSVQIVRGCDSRVQKQWERPEEVSIARARPGILDLGLGLVGEWPSPRALPLGGVAAGE